VDGRWLTADEYLADGAHSALVNEATVRQYWPNVSAVGQRFSFFNDPRVFEIVGVVEDVALSDLEGPTDAAVYFPFAKTALPFAVLHARTGGDAALVMAAVQEEIESLDPQVAVQGAGTAEDILSQTLWPRRMGAALLSIFAALALVMAAAGIHAVMSYTSALRRHEIGVRMALGAEAGGVLWLVLRQGMALVGLGAVLGVAAAIAGGSLVADMLYGVSLTDPTTLMLVPGVLGLVALVACGIPAWRSTRVHPVQALQPDSR
jgi:putative ABC transport system permease protein